MVLWPPWCSCGYCGHLGVHVVTVATLVFMWLLWPPWCSCGYCPPWIHVVTVVTLVFMRVLWPPWYSCGYSGHLDVHVGIVATLVFMWVLWPPCTVLYPQQMFRSKPYWLLDPVVWHQRVSDYRQFHFNGTIISWVCVHYCINKRTGLLHLYVRSNTVNTHD